MVPVAAGDLGQRLAAECVAALVGPGSVAVICADQQAAEIAAALRVAGLGFSVLGDSGRAGRSGRRTAAHR